MYATSSYNAFKLHVRRRHPRVEITADLVMGEDNIDDNDPHQNDLIPEIDMHETVRLDSTNKEHNRSFVILLAKYFLTLETEHKVSKISLDDIAGGTEFLISTVCQKSSEKMKAILLNSGKTEEEVTEILKTFSDELHSEVILSSQQFFTNYSRESIYKNLCKMILPEPLCLGYKNTIRNGKVIRKKVMGYYVPLAKMLQALLNLPEIWHYFENPRFSTDGIQRDVNDGSHVAGHRLNQNPHNFLKLSLNYDDVEIQNPLRSSQKYKMAMFYYQILNIPVQFRSKLTSVFLYGICPTKSLANSGLDKMLRDFTATVNQLSTEGITMIVNGVEQKIYGTLLYAICDTPAAAALGGYKESSAFADKPCRRCFADQNSLREHFRERDFRLRTLPGHLDICQDLNDPTISKQMKVFYSKLYGVKSVSPLLKITDFDITNCLLQDNLHVITEGLACNVLGLFFHRCIIEYRFFTLKWLNSKIQNYQYTANEHGHRPEIITKQQVFADVHIKQKAVAMLSLLFALPHILGPLFKNGDEHYRHLIIFVKITQLLFSPYSNENSWVELESLVDIFGRKWAVMYPMSRIKPKLHFLVHFVEQMKKFGSLHGPSCLRYESKHGWFKDWRTRNFKNIAFSLAKKHQMFLCHKMLDINGAPAKNFVYTGDEIGDGNLVIISRHDVQRFDCFTRRFGQQEEFHIYETNSVNIEGIGYVNRMILLVEIDELGHPLFGQIENIFVKDEIKYFYINLIEADCYLWQYHSYEVSYTENFRLISWGELANKFTLKMQIIEDKKLVMNKYCQYSGPDY